VVPNYRCGAESQCPATFLQTPADIDVISSHFEAIIKSSDLAQPIQTKGHVAARNMFGNFI
jgi:hypothetical protein